MLTQKPEYFDKISHRARERWIQLENDPELAGPWHQLFAQVQSPRHVLSELLQNADDANAKSANAYICNGEFVFEHDGDDFTEEHFSSLCRFGYSNKRSLYTIGFRGIGFKSIFSLGDEVKLLTPTLSVLFKKQRFTEPLWYPHESDIIDAKTQIRIAIKDTQRQQELEKNLNEWSSSPISLLFFRHIQTIQIRGVLINRQSLGTGPIDNSEWVKLSQDPKNPYLIIRSQEAEFPKDAIDEIRQERMGSENFELPPCRIDLVVAPNMISKLYVVLPTGVETSLPFICNAPFIQDPARLKIKDPETSPTNRWLLERAGKFAAQSMLSWLHQENLQKEDRAKAYILLPDIDRNNNTIEGVCGKICEESFEEAIEGQDLLICENGVLVSSGKAISISSVLYDIWKPKQISHLFDREHRDLICKDISSENIKKLENWNLIERIPDTQIIEVLRRDHCPKPETWRQLLWLWDFVFKKSDCINRGYRASYQIVPVQNKDVLFASSDVVRIGEKKLLKRPEDWDFLSDFLLAINNGWIHFLAKQALKAKQCDNRTLLEQIENANNLLKDCKLDEASDVSRLINSVAEKFYAQDEITLESCVRLAHISAALNVSVNEHFEYFTRDGYRRCSKDIIIADIDCDLDFYLNENFYKKHSLHEAYFKEYLSCTQAQWFQWIVSERSGVLGFIPAQLHRQDCRSRQKLVKLCADRGITNYAFPYVRNYYVIDDWDFAAEHWEFWKNQAGEDDTYWGKLFSKIIQMPRRAWANTLSIKISQVATTGNTRSITSEEAPTAWILKFRDLPCLQDTRGFYRKPTELFRRTPQTEPLLDVERFIKAELDTEQNRPLLIKLGLQDRPTGPELLLERIKALARATAAPIYEIQRWYHRLDQIINHCSTEELQLIKSTFSQQPLILAHDETWAKSNEIFLQDNQEEVPYAITIHPTVRDLSLWHKIGVAVRPSAELVINWLKTLKSGSKLTSSEARRVLALLPRHSHSIWDECAHWLNLDGQWVSTDQLEYKLTLQSLVSWSHLFPAIKQKTADCRSLPFDVCNLSPFTQLQNLSDLIEYRISEGEYHSASSTQKEWMKVLGFGISRIKLSDETEGHRIQELGLRLSRTRWQPTNGLEVVPYIGGTPAGTPRQTSVAWKDDIFFVQDCDVARIFKAVADELARPFDRPEISEAIKACVDRSGTFINDYLEENFRLMPPELIVQEVDRQESPGAPKPTEQSTEAPGDARPQSTETEPAEQKEGDIEAGHNTPEPPAIPVTEEDQTIDPDETEQEREGRKPEDVEKPQPVTRTIIPNPPRPSLMELFAKSLGYVMDRQRNRYFRSDGSWIQKEQGKVFPWEHYSPDGQLLRSYWLKEHCLYQKPLQLDAEVWNLCSKNPKQYAIVLIDTEGNPVELTGQELLELQQSKQLTLYPAEYRLVFDTNHEDAV